MVFLAEVFLSEVVRVSPAVAPLKHLVRRHVDVLEVLVLVVPDGNCRSSFFFMTRLAKYCDVPD